MLLFTHRYKSLWQQIFNPTGRGAGMFVQLNWSCGNAGSARCGEDGGAYEVGPHKSQQSLLSVLISEVGDKMYFGDNYSALSSGQVLEGDHYWSYKRRSARNSISDGIYASTDETPQLTFGINPISCISGVENGCFFGDDKSYDSNIIGAPSTAIISTSDPCEMDLHTKCRNTLGEMELGVMHSMAQTTDSSDPKYKTGTFYQGIVHQQQINAQNTLVDAINLSGSNSWRSSQINSSNSWKGRMAGLFITDMNDSSNPHPQYFFSEAEVKFDDVNDRVQIDQINTSIQSKDAINNTWDDGVNDWYHSQNSFVGRNSNLLQISNQTGFQFGKADPNSAPGLNTLNNESNPEWTRSAYFNKKVFGAILQNDSKQLSCSVLCSLIVNDSTDNAGAMVSWDSIDNKDKDWIVDSSTEEPSLEYMTWGVWALAMSDSQQDKIHHQTSAVHIGSWYAGDLLDVSDWPVDRTATLAGLAMFDIFARVEDEGIISSYQWTEGSSASGIVDFAANGTYDISIMVNDLGKENCSQSYCGSGFTDSMNNGAIGNITWTSSNNPAGQSYFESEQSSYIGEGANRVSTLQKMWGELYGVSSHVESGAILQFSRENNSELIMMTGTAILSE